MCKSGDIYGNVWDYRSNLMFSNLFYAIINLNNKEYGI